MRSANLRSPENSSKKKLWTVVRASGLRQTLVTLVRQQFVFRHTTKYRASSSNTNSDTYPQRVEMWRIQKTMKNHRAQPWFERRAAMLTDREETRALTFVCRRPQLFFQTTKGDLNEHGAQIETQTEELHCSLQSQTSIACPRKDVWTAELSLMHKHQRKTESAGRPIEGQKIFKSTKIFRKALCWTPHNIWPENLSSGDLITFEFSSLSIWWTQGQWKSSHLTFLQKNFPSPKIAQVFSRSMSAFAKFMRKQTYAVV